jgi:hypothetical protein
VTRVDRSIEARCGLASPAVPWLIGGTLLLGLMAAFVAVGRGYSREILAALGILVFGVLLTWGVERLPGSTPRSVRIVLFVLGNVPALLALLVPGRVATFAERKPWLALVAVPGFLVATYTTNAHPEAYVAVVVSSLLVVLIGGLDARRPTFRATTAVLRPAHVFLLAICLVGMFFGGTRQSEIPGLVRQTQARARLRHPAPGADDRGVRPALKAPPTSPARPRPRDAGHKRADRGVSCLRCPDGPAGGMWHRGSGSLCVTSVFLRCSWDGHVRGSRVPGSSRCRPRCSSPMVSGRPSPGSREHGDGGARAAQLALSTTFLFGRFVTRVIRGPGLRLHGLGRRGLWRPARPGGGWWAALGLKYLGLWLVLGAFASELGTSSQPCSGAFLVFLARTVVLSVMFLVAGNSY